MQAVLACRADNPDDKVIIKQIQIQDNALREDALREAGMLSQFDHVNIIHYYECVLEDDCLHIVMEYASEGDLADLIAKRAEEKKGFTEDEIMFWCAQPRQSGHAYHGQALNVLSWTQSISCLLSGTDLFALLPSSVCVGPGPTCFSCT